MAIGLTTALLGSSLLSAGASAYSANQASKTQARAANNAAALQQQQYEETKALLAPYTQAGTQALTQQQDLMGLNGIEAQQAAINNIMQGGQYTTGLQQGENAIRQNASATGGLRGGNTQKALSEFAPTLLNSLINQQYANLGGMTSLGQNSAAMTGNAGMQTASNIGDLMQQAAAAKAGGTLSIGNTLGNLPANILGQMYGLNKAGYNTGGAIKF